MMTVGLFPFHTAWYGGSKIGVAIKGHTQGRAPVAMPPTLACEECRRCTISAFIN